MTATLSVTQQGQFENWNNYRIDVQERIKERLLSISYFNIDIKTLTK